MPTLNFTSFILFIAIFSDIPLKHIKNELNSKICKNYKDGQFIGDCDI